MAFGFVFLGAALGLMTSTAMFLLNYINFTEALGVHTLVGVAAILLGATLTATLPQMDEGKNHL